MKPDYWGFVGVVLCLLAIAGVVLMWNDMLPLWAIYPILMSAAVGALLIIDDRRPQ